MPVLLTAPFNPGDIDPGKQYREAKIVSFRCFIEPQPGVEIIVQHGNTVGGKWVPGSAPLKTFYIRDQKITRVDTIEHEGRSVEVPVTVDDNQYTQLVQANAALYKGIGDAL